MVGCARFAAWMVSAALLAASPPAWAQSAAERPGEAEPQTERLGAALDDLSRENPVLARVNGREIRWADIEKSARDLPEEYRSQLETIFPALLQRLIDIRLLVWDARERGLAEDPEVRRRVAEFEERLLSETLIQSRVTAQVTEEMLQARYKAHVEALSARAEVRARHILLDSEARAREVIAELDKGADFVELARERSLGPTAAQGGDLDYFTRDNMVPAFAEAAFSLGVGEYSREPVQTEFGWHVIRVEDRRAEQPAPFAEMRGALTQAITRDLLDDLLRELRGRAEIELYPGARRVE